MASTLTTTNFTLIDGKYISFGTNATMSYSSSNMTTNIAVSSPTFLMTGTTDCVQFSFTTLASRLYGAVPTKITDVTFNTTVMSYVFDTGRTCYLNFPLPIWYTNGTNITVSAYLIPVDATDGSLCSLNFTYYWDEIGVSPSGTTVNFPFTLNASDNGKLVKPYIGINGSGHTCDSIIRMSIPTSLPSITIRLLMLRFEIQRRGVAIY